MPCLREERPRGARSASKRNAGLRRESFFPTNLALRVVWKWLDELDGLSSMDFPGLWARPNPSMKVSSSAGCRCDVVYFLKLSDDVIRERDDSRLTCRLRLGFQREVS